MSAANTAVPPAAARGAAPARRGAAAESGNDKPDWRWQIGKAVIFYAAFQGVLGPNGLVAWYKGNLPSQKATSPSIEKAASPESTTIQGPFSVPAAAPVARIPSNASTTALYGINSAIDFYVFVTTHEAPSPDDITTQFSTLVPGAKGPRSVDIIDFDDEEYATLLQDPVREAMSEPQIWSPSKEGKVLAGVKWSNLPLNDDLLLKNVDLLFKVPSEVQSANASLWAEIYATPAGLSPKDQRTTARMRKCE
jgi:hypothetical protein